jgi:hypothetical protein
MLRAQGRRATRLRYAPTNRVAILPYFENSLLLWSAWPPHNFVGSLVNQPNCHEELSQIIFGGRSKILFNLCGLNREMRSFPSCDATGNFTNGIKSIALQQTRGNG